ncbi:MAG: hypothetical protein GEU87_00445 [Alphaproteobacteria bacterium]|nr:hypothetical protein [Alphaproteobacteria bacterium]
MLAAAISSLILLGSTHAGATGPHGGHDGNGAKNGNKTTILTKNHNSNANNSTNNKINNNANANTSRSDSRASADANAESGSSGGDGGSSDVSVDGGDEAPASSAAAVYVTTSDDTCMGSSSGGGQAESFGFSVGSTWTDSNCIMLKNARELKAQGHHKAAKARLCMDEDNAMAFELAGEPCPRALASTQAAIAKLRAADPSYVAAGEPAMQLAMLGGGVGGAVADGGSGDTPRLGVLLAMVQSAVQHVAAAITPSAPSDDFSDPDLLYGIE